MTHTVNSLGQRSNVAQAGSAFAATRNIAWGYDGYVATTTGGKTTVFVHDGWNPVAEWSADLQYASLTKTYIWGMGVAGASGSGSSLQGAGDVGGLLAVTDSTGTCYPTYDGNGHPP